MSVFTKIVDWFSRGFSFHQPVEMTTTPTRDEPRRPATRDWTDALTVNAALTKGLFHNSYPGMKLAGGLAFAPIVVPVWFMGLPVPESVDEDEATNEICKTILEAFAMDIKQIHIQAHRDGTCWIWPHYDATGQELIWEFIPDETICDIFRDLATGHIIKIITDEEIKISIAENQTATARRKRIFTDATITESWVSAAGLPVAMQPTKTFVNVSGILPIPFANNSDGDEVRGHSDYERILTDLKDYHDIDLKTSQLLAKFNIKMIQEVNNVDEWKKSNSITNLNTLDIEHIDLIFNLKDKESTEFIFPASAAFDASENRLKTKFRKIVEESMIPELAWGVKVEGNMASADKQVEQLVMYVNDKRDQKNEPYKKLFQASIMLLGIANMRKDAPAIKITWNKLDAISELTKSQIFQAFATGVSQIMGAAGITKQFLYNIIKKNYPEATTETLEEFVKGLSDMAQFKQYVGANYIQVYDMEHGIEPAQPVQPGVQPGGDGKPPAPGEATPDAPPPVPDNQQQQIDGPSGST